VSSADRPGNPSKMKLFVRLTSEIDDRLRKLLRHRGDLSRLIEEAVTTTDLHSVALLAPSGMWDGKGTTATTFAQLTMREADFVVTCRCDMNGHALIARHPCSVES
jgi:hypothetical protein